MRRFGLWRRSTDRGQGMSEYIIIVALIAIACIVVVSLFGKQIKAMFAGMSGAISGSSDMVNVDKTATTDAGDEAGKKSGLDTLKSVQTEK